MSDYLLACSIGPIQEFIAAARRTRDLWFGSHLLSQISKAVAKAIAEEIGQEKLIFPAVSDLALLQADSQLTVANIILAEIPSTITPQEIASVAREAAKDYWLQNANQTEGYIQNLTRSSQAGAINQELWKEQIADVVEFYSAWVPMGTDYKKARGRVMRLLAGRKACRDFLQPSNNIDLKRVPKSSLDGRRETVLKRNNSKSDLDKRLRLAEGEQLDVVGLVKRLGNKKQPYPSVARIAADPWLRKVERVAANNPSFEQLKASCETLGNNVIHTINREKFPQYKIFPFEGTTVYPSRYQDLSEETGVPVKQLQNELSEPVKGLDNYLGEPVRELAKILGGEPSPYVAILVADGDRMGKVISEIDSPEKHRRFSEELCEFAKYADEIIKKEYGICVYAGGDDVLAFLPVDHALSCARRLSEKFLEILQDWKDSSGNVPTLSVGLAIGHFMEPLEDLRCYGQIAEKLAKQKNENRPNEIPFKERNGLAILIYPRSGCEFGVREQWQDGNDSLDARLKSWADLFAEGHISTSLAHDLQLLATDYHHWQNANLPLAIQSDVSLVLKRKKINPEHFSNIIPKLQDANDISRLANELLVARRLAPLSMNDVTPVQIQEVEV